MTRVELRAEVERAAAEVATWSPEHQFAMWREATAIERGEPDYTPTPALRELWEWHRRITTRSGWMEAGV